MQTEKTSQRTAPGLWGKSHVPKRGWTCVECYDHGEEQLLICQMCTIQSIRYIHIMTHPEYPTQLECGCICAGRMENIEVARKRERQVRNKTARRLTFPDRHEWKVNRNGNEVINKHGYQILIYRKNERYKIRLTLPNQEVEWGTLSYNSLRVAKLAAFDAVERFSA